MAIITPGSLIGSISGDVDGVNFVNGRGSKVLRKTKRKVPLNSDSNALAQTHLLQEINHWRSLSLQDKTAWETYAAQNPISNRIGIARALSGYQMFLHINLWLLSVRRAAEDLPPARPAEPTIQITGFTSVAPFDMKMFFAAGAPGAELVGFLYGRPLYRSSSIRFNNQWRFLGPITDVGLSPVSIIGTWTLEFPFPVLGQYVALRFIPTNDDPRRRYPAYDAIVETTA